MEDGVLSPFIYLDVVSYLCYVSLAVHHQTFWMDVTHLTVALTNTKRSPAVLRLQCTELWNFLFFIKIYEHPTRSTQTH